MANAIEIGSDHAIRISGRSDLGSSANLGRTFLRLETRSPPRNIRVRAELGAANGTGPEVRSGDLAKPILLTEGQMFNFTIKRGISLEATVSVNYGDFIHDVEVGDVLLVDGGMMSLVVRSKTADTVKCEVVDGGELKSRRHLNMRGKSATLPSITEKDWEDIKFGVDNKVNFYAVSVVKDAKVIHELKDYLKSKFLSMGLLLDTSAEVTQELFTIFFSLQGCNADIHVIVKIEIADSIPNLHSIISASDGAMVARGDLGAELPIEEVPLLQAIYGGEFFQSHLSAMYASHATTMANILSTPIIVFTRTGSMAIRLSHCRPSSSIFAFTNEL